MTEPNLGYALNYCLLCRADMGPEPHNKKGFCDTCIGEHERSGKALPILLHFVEKGSDTTLCGLPAIHRDSVDISKTVSCPYCRDNGGIETYYCDARAEIVKEEDKISFKKVGTNAI